MGPLRLLHLYSMPRDPDQSHYLYIAIMILPQCTYTQVSLTHDALHSSSYVDLRQVLKSWVSCIVLCCIALGVSWSNKPHF